MKNLALDRFCNESIHHWIDSYCLDFEKTSIEPIQWWIDSVGCSFKLFGKSAQFCSFNPNLFYDKINTVLTASIGVFYKTLDIVGQCFIHHVSIHKLDSWIAFDPMISNMSFVFGSMTCFESYVKNACSLTIL